jgi:CCR4-NOT transcription complex subunit 1
VCCRLFLGARLLSCCSQDRSLLKNLALWLGRITLARNKPILHRDLNVKELLLEGYESGRLVACVSFVAKVRW